MLPLMKVVNESTEIILSSISITHNAVLLWVFIMYRDCWKMLLVTKK